MFVFSSFVFPSSSSDDKEVDDEEPDEFELDEDESDKDEDEVADFVAFGVPPVESFCGFVIEGTIGFAIVVVMLVQIKVHGAAWQ